MFTQEKLTSILMRFLSLRTTKKKEAYSSDYSSSEITEETSLGIELGVYRSKEKNTNYNIITHGHRSKHPSIHLLTVLYYTRAANVDSQTFQSR